MKNDQVGKVSIQAKNKNWLFPDMNHECTISTTQ